LNFFLIIAGSAGVAVGWESLFFRFRRFGPLNMMEGVVQQIYRRVSTIAIPADSKH
jgi:uncharacterized membrane protein SpoIIM required for sporulation